MSSLYPFSISRYRNEHKNNENAFEGRFYEFMQIHKINLLTSKYATSHTSDNIDTRFLRADLKAMDRLIGHLNDLHEQEVYDRLHNPEHLAETFIDMEKTKTEIENWWHHLQDLKTYLRDEDFTNN